jgi:8-oxo-dGTP pyrophosphatase MutT (NUDIX family)
VTPFRVVAETARADAGFLALHDLEIEGPDGERFVRHVVRHPGAVMVVPVEADREHVLLVRQYRAAVDRELLEVPAGKRDEPGEAPEATARRELEEEIGVRADQLIELCECFMSPGFTDEYAHMYCALGLTSVDRRAATHEEASMTIQRVPLGQLDELIASRALVDVKSIASLLLTQRLLAESPSGATRHR